MYKFDESSTWFIFSKEEKEEDTNTRLNVMTDMSGNLVGGWKLGEEQIKYLLSTGAIK